MFEQHKQEELKRSLGLFSITMIGVGAMIGAGIFVLTGIAAGAAGPALILVFLLNGIVTTFTALAYAELGSAIPEAGGGYLWVKDSLSKLQGFLSGWMSWFAHAVAGSLYAIGFGAYFGLVLANWDVPLFGLEGDFLKKLLAALVAVLFIYINYKGASETGTAGNIVTVAKMLILGVFIASGIYVMFHTPGWTAKFTPFLPVGFGGVLAAMGLTFIAFEGYEIIAQTGEEAVNPKKTIPRAILLSLIIVVPIYILIALVSIGALIAPEGQTTWQFLGIHKELGLVEAAKQFMPFGTILLLIGGLMSTMSALNATTYSSTRVFFAMSRDHNLPHSFRKVSQKTKVPHIALLFSGLLIIFVAVALPIEDIAAAADVMFLLLFLQVNIAVIVIRKKWGDKLDYGYKMPLFPYLPIIAIIINTLLTIYLFKYRPLSLYVTILWFIVGGIIYYAYSKGKEHVEVEKEHREEFPEEYHMVVAINNYENIKPLMKISAGLAKHRKSDVVVLNVIEVPKHEFVHSGKALLEERGQLVDKAEEEGKSLGVGVRKKISIGYDASKAIQEFLESAKTNILLLGWTGEIHETKIRRSVPHAVLHSSLCNVCIVKVHRAFREIKSIAVPIGLGVEEHRYRLKMADEIARTYGAEITLISVIKKGDEAMRAKIREIQKNASEICQSPIKRKLIKSHRSLVDVLITKSKNYDLMLIGPSREWVYGGVLLGTMQDKLANKAKCTVMLVKQPEHNIEKWSNLALKKFLNFFVKR